MPTIVNLIDEVADLQQNQIAAYCSEEEISYADLVKRSALFAEYLQRQFGHEATIIAVMMDRSIDMLVALLGILRSGHAYLPIDPLFPTERIAYMLEHSKAPVIIQDNSTHDKISLPSGITPLNIQNISYSGQPNTTDFQSKINASQANSLAYVIYTSGSTGKPKGVKILHSSLMNFIQGTQAQLNFSVSHTLAAVTTLSFDISILELFLPLCTGGKVKIIQSETSSNGEKLAAALTNDNKITHMQATPSTWQMLYDSGYQIPNITILMGGEPPPESLVKKLLEQCTALWNMYGPTETTIWSSCCQIQDATDITIGKPIGDQQLYVLNDRLEPVAKGQEGLLYIGGMGLAEGYLHRDDLTEERFILLPNNERAYNTGDVVVLRHDNQIQYRRRADNQVKLRGFRIELGEIEAQLNTHQGISQSIVFVKGESADAELIAFLTLTQTPPVTSKSIRAHLADHLPAYMIPSRFISLSQMPLTPNGKIDRNNLPDLSAGTPIPENNQIYVAPQTAVERQISEIWQEVLNREKISTNANIYEIGGHSLLITRIWAKLREIYGHELKLNLVFQHPTISDQAAAINSLSTASGAQHKIPRIPRMKAPQMSLAQQRFWYINQVVPQKSFYNLCAAFRFRGNLDTEALSQAFDVLIARHEILRTSLDWSHEQPKQVISKSIQYQLPQLDLTLDSDEPSESKLMDILNSKIHEPIRLDTAPLFNSCLIKIGETEHVLFFTPHHVIWDGWSFDIFLHELKIIYEACLSGTTPDLAPLEIQYADFSAWHNAYLREGAIDNQLAYWREQLKGDLPILALPQNAPRPSQFSYEGSIEEFELEQSLVLAAHALAQQFNTTLNIILISVYATVLSRHTSQQEIIIGSPIQGRLRSEVENLIGLFVNTLPLRISVTPGLTFVELVQQIKSTATDAYQNQEVPFERIVEELQIERDLSRTPIFQSLFTFQEVSDRQYTIDHLAIDQINLHNGTCPVDISFWVKASQTNISGAIEFNTDVFNAASIQSFLRHLIQCLNDVVTNPAQLVRDIQIITNDELSTLLHRQNDTFTEFDQNGSVVNAINKTAECFPSNAAVTTDNATLSYQELIQLSSKIAHSLSAIGIQNKDLVAVCTSRNTELPAILLAIWQCGAAYVPLDASLPKARLDYIVEHSGAKLILTEKTNEQLFSNQSNVQLIESLNYETNPSTPLTRELSGDDIAYVIYTSGSTGKPKGVLVPHKSVMNFLNAMAIRPGITNHDRVLAITTLSFDIHVLEFWLPLSVGATMVLLSSEQAANGIALKAAIDKHDVSLIQATPSTWNLLKSCDWQEHPNIKALIGGELPSSEIVNYLLSNVGSLWNMYGPTETTVWSVCHKLEKDENLILIGTPIANTQTYVLDEHQRLVPEGVEGELYIGGLGLTLGYHHDAEKTNHAFCKVDLPDIGQTTLYRTGDIVISHACGNMEYRRRRDNQVKVRGYRIELGDIESALASLDNINEALVIVREDVPGDKRIVAYLVNEPGTLPTITEVRNKLKLLLPNYMIPQFIVNVPEFPKTPNGKIDRKALPVPYATNQQASANKPKPSGQHEELIADIWKKLLKNDNIYRNDNFFELGGHSLLSMEFINEIRGQTNVLFTPRDVILSDLSQLAKKLDESNKQNTTGSAAANNTPEKQKKRRFKSLLDRFK